MTDKLIQLPEVEWFCATTGRFDGFAFLRFAPNESMTFLIRNIITGIEGVKDSETFICLVEHKKIYQGWGSTEIKKILLELHKLENVLEYATGRLRHVFHQLMMLIKEADLAKEDKLKKKATQAPKAKRTAKATNQ